MQPAISSNVTAGIGAGSIAAWGVAGVTPARALKIGLWLGVGSGMALTLLRQPLPVLPPGLGW